MSQSMLSRASVDGDGGDKDNRTTGSDNLYSYYTILYYTILC